MMRWKTVEPDAKPLDLGSTLSALPFPDSITLASILISRPLVFFSNEAQQTITDHVTKGKEERGGLLLGFAATPDNEVGAAMPHPLICITDAVPSEQYTGTSVSLHMDPSVWTAASVQRNDGLLVVGWFHSHPNLGAFFSGTDRRTQCSFFTHAYSIGYVIDPYRDDHAYFLGPDCQEIAERDVIQKVAKLRLLSLKK